MVDDVILARFQGEVGDLKKKIDDYIASLEKAAGAEKGVQTELEKLLAKQRKSYQETGKLAAITAKDIKATGLSIAELGKKIREALDKPIVEATTKVKTLGSESKKASKEVASTFDGLGQSIKSSLNSVASALGIAFSVGAAVQFGKASIEAFEEAEVAAQRLKFAVVDLGGAGEIAFQKLIDQSKELQKVTTFSDDSIQQAQASLSAFGLSASRIEELIPGLADFATVLGVDIAEAANVVGQGLQGAGREFKRFGINVSANNTVLENYQLILDGVNLRTGAAAAATETFAGKAQQLRNELDDLQEGIGEKLAGSFLNAKVAALSFFSTVLAGIFGVDDELKKNNETREKTLKQRVESQLIGQNEINQLGIIANAENEITKIKEGQSALLKQLSAAALKDQKSEERRLFALRAENEKTLGILEDIIEAAKIQAEEDKKTLKANDLKGLSLERLNELLKENSKSNQDFAQSNVTLIQREIDLIKKRNEELEKKDKRTPGERVGLIVPIDTPDNGPELEANKKKLTAREQQEKEFTEFLEKENKKRVDDTLKTANEEEDIYERMQESLLASYLSRFEREISDTSAFLDKLSSVYSQFTSIRIENIEKEKEAKLAQLDIEEDSIEQQLDKRRISETEAQKLSDELLQKRTKAEADAQKKIRAEKRKAAILEKAAALVHIAIDTAKNSTEQPGPYGILIPFWVALGAAEAALVASQPTPYEKGTKHSKKGLARVGEKGEELMMLPEGTKIAPAGPSKKHSKLFDAIVDDDVDDYILKTWVTPRLEKQRREFEKQREISFAKNMADSIILNTTVQRGQDINNAVLENNTRKAADKLSTLAPDIAKALSPYLQHDIYR